MKEDKIEKNTIERNTVEKTEKGGIFVQISERIDLTHGKETIINIRDDNPEKAFQTFKKVKATIK